MAPTPAAANEPIPIPTINTQPSEPVKFEIDRDRLYDVSYLADPELIAYADSLDVTPECIVKVERGEAELNNRSICRLVSSEAHVLQADNGIDYRSLMLEQLQEMSASDAYASFLVGGYYINNGEPDLATPHYERAVALSGKATSIMFIRETTVHPEVLEYELLLVAEALGRKPQPIARFMAINGLEADMIAEAEQRAQVRLDRLTKLRQELVGRPWETTRERGNQATRPH